MDAPLETRGVDLGSKIARLVEERGWNQEDFARSSGLNRHTVREIMNSNGERKLRNDTISKCAKALGLQVNELRDLPLDRLLPRMHGKVLSEREGGRKLLLEKSEMPELKEWVSRNTERAAQITVEEAEELLSLQGPDGVLARIGVEYYVEILERRRRLLNRVKAIAKSEYFDLLEQFVGLLYEKIPSHK
ncbi:MAG: helix-turn-helix domain-containing protein [Gemmataceae bacterium]|jgi:transcriptional regulator with XRE-family HTH domain|nr:helix-turn-helix domain-containing protein [Gemmataceae bacterium]